MTNINLMIDIETLSTKPNGVIASIGAVFFNPEDGRIGKTFCQQICTDISQKDGFITDQSTIDWWSKQSQEARDLSLMGDQKPQETLIHFKDFLKDNCDNTDQLIVWANSPSFDLVMLKQHFDRYDMKTPWIFLNERDVRTYKEIGDLIGINQKHDTTGEKHHALDDCISQLLMVSRVKWALKNLIHDSERLTHMLAQQKG